MSDILTKNDIKLLLPETQIEIKYKDIEEKEITKKVMIKKLSQGAINRISGGAPEEATTGFLYHSLKDNMQLTYEDCEDFPPEITKPLLEAIHKLNNFVTKKEVEEKEKK